MKRVFVSGNSDIFHGIIKDCLALEKTSAILQDNVVSWINVLRYAYNQEYDGLNLCARNILINYLYNAHQAVPGSELWFLKFLYGNYKIKKIKRVSSSEAVGISKKLLKKERSINIFSAIPDLLGSTGKIVVSSEKNQEDTLKLTTGSTISMDLDPKFMTQIATSDISIEHCKVLILEGAPASVAEINKLLTHCFENKTKLLFLARSFPDEVVSTLSVNWLKNNLSVVPMVYGNNLSNINSHADLATVSGAVPVSKMFGDTMQIDFVERFGVLKDVKISENEILCTPTKSTHYLVNDLLERIKNISHTDAEAEKAALLYERVAGLSGERLDISLKESRDVEIIKEELDTIIPYYSYLCYSAAEVELNGSIETIPYQVYKQADKMRNEFVHYVNSIGGYLVQPNK